MIFSLSSIIGNTLAAATPIALSGVGGMFGERSGVSNIGLEGSMLASAFMAVVGSYYTGNPWGGLLCGVLTGMLVSLLHAFFCITLKVNQTIIGLAVNILAANLTVYASSSIFGKKGFSSNVTQLPDLSIPILRDLPIFGDVFGNLSIITVLIIPVCMMAHYLLYKTPFGPHVIAIGQNPQAAYVASVKVIRTQYIAVMIGGLACGLAGSYLSISYLNLFVRDMVSGRGFIALAAIIFGRYSPWGILGASLFFGFTSAVQMSLQGTVNIPNEWIQCIPYVFTILIVTLNERRAMKNSVSIA